MDNIGQYFYLFILLFAPLILPALLRKWTWVSVTGIGYLLYIIIGIDLYYTSEITEFGTGYGMMIVPYVIVISFIGKFVQNRKDKKVI